MIKIVIFRDLSNWIFTFHELVKCEFSRPSKSSFIRQKATHTNNYQFLHQKIVFLCFRMENEKEQRY